MATNEPTIPERVDQLNQAFGAKPGGVPSFRAEHEGDDYLFGTAQERVVVTLLARVGDSGVLNEIATLIPDVTSEPIDDENRQPGDAREATVRVEFDLAGALRAAADEIDRDLGNVTAPAYETLGDIADAFRAMKDDGMTRSSILYALERVYPKHEESDEAPEHQELLERMRVAYTEAWEAEDARMAERPAGTAWPEHARSRAGMAAAILELQKVGR